MASDVNVDVEKDKRSALNQLWLFCCLLFLYCLFYVFRIIYLKDYTIKTLRIKPDKWAKLCNSDEVKHLLVDFVSTGPYFYPNVKWNLMLCYSDNFDLMNALSIYLINKIKKILYIRRK